MKIFEWIQKKLNNGSDGKKKSNSISTSYYMLHEPCKQEWPMELLVIGTFGSNYSKEDSDSINCTGSGGDSSSSHQDCVLQDFTLENELNIYFPESNWVTDQINQRRSSSLEVIEENENETENSNGGNFYPNSDSGLIHRLINKSSVNGKKSLAFLLKKMFVCTSGFPPTLSFKDQLISKESRTMEKILRAMLHKRLYHDHQGSSSAIFVNKYQLENRHMPKDDEEEQQTSTTIAYNNGSKWDNTDSEYIVLEI